MRCGPILDDDVGIPSLGGRSHRHGAFNQVQLAHELVPCEQVLDVRPYLPDQPTPSWPYMRPWRFKYCSRYCGKRVAKELSSKSTPFDGASSLDIFLGTVASNVEPSSQQSTMTTMPLTPPMPRLACCWKCSPASRASNDQYLHDPMVCPSDISSWRQCLGHTPPCELQNALLRSVRVCSFTWPHFRQAPKDRWSRTLLSWTSSSCVHATPGVRTLNRPHFGIGDHGG